MGIMFSYCRCIYSNNHNDLMSYDDKTKLFSFQGQNKYAKVVKVYDADTIQVVFKVHENYYRFKCRLSRIDSPEIKSHDPLEKEKAKISRDMLKNRILNKIVKIKCGDFDKYGRILIELYDGNINLNDWLLNNHYAIKYDGGTKNIWTKNILNQIKMQPNNIGGDLVV